MTNDYKELRAVCDAATQGEWEIEHVNHGVKGLMVRNRDAKFIATFNPTKVLALLDKLERYEDELKIMWQIQEHCKHYEMLMDSQDLSKLLEKAEALKEKGQS